MGPGRNFYLLPALPGQSASEERKKPILLSYSLQREELKKEKCLLLSSYKTSLLWRAWLRMGSFKSLQLPPAAT